jgi:hypothetical protein
VVDEGSQSPQCLHFFACAWTSPPQSGHSLVTSTGLTLVALPYAVPASVLPNFCERTPSLLMRRTNQTPKMGIPRSAPRKGTAPMAEMMAMADAPRTRKGVPRRYAHFRWWWGLSSSGNRYSGIRKNLRGNWYSYWFPLCRDEIRMGLRGLHPARRVARPTAISPLPDVSHPSIRGHQHHTNQKPAQL